jgi:hypothetical protein
MDMRVFVDPDWWKRTALKLLVKELVRREREDLAGWDPADDEELFEATLLALYPLDGFDGRKGGLPEG